MSSFTSGNTYFSFDASRDTSVRSKPAEDNCFTTGCPIRPEALRTAIFLKADISRFAKLNDGRFSGKRGPINLHFKCGRASGAIRELRNSAWLQDQINSKQTRRKIQREETMKSSGHNMRLFSRDWLNRYGHVPSDLNNWRGVPGPLRQTRYIRNGVFSSVLSLVLLSI